VTASHDERLSSLSGALCVHDVLAARAEASPDACAVSAPGRGDLTYGRLLSHVESTVGALNGMGVARNDRVAIVLPNGPEMAVAFLAVAAGATCAPLNPAYRAPEFDFYLSDLNARALILPAGTQSPAREVARERSIPVIELSVLEEAPAGVFALEGRSGAPAARGGFAQPDDVALVLHTSGTTSRPKIVPLAQANMCVSAHNIRDSLDLTAADRCLNVMPLFHIHGLVAALLSSLVAGGSVVCTPGFDAERFFGWLEDFRPTWYTAVPTMHQAILSHAESGSQGAVTSSLRFIRSCSSALPPKVMARLEETFGVPVVEAYGMTEASHQMASNPLPPRRRKPGSVGIAAGPEVAIMDGAGELLALGQTGEIVIRGPNVTRGYENNPAANQSAFTNGWFRTGDEGFLDSERYLQITGRLKEIINRGGEKVSPREVDDVLTEHPAVAQAVTFAVAHPKLGEDVVAAVVLRDGASVTELALRDFVAARIAAHKVPRQVLTVEEIPKGPTGKMQRISLGERLGHLLKAEFVAPESRVERVLAGMWADLLKLERVGVRDNFFTAGGSSLLAVEMIARVQEACGVELELDSVFRQPTVADLAAIIQERIDRGEPTGGGPPQASQSAVVPVQPNGSRPPFFMVGLGLGWEVRELPRHLGPDQPVYGLRPSALLGGGDLEASAPALAAYYIDQMRSVRPHGPYVLGGGCAAGLVAYEMAQQLTAQGESVPLLVLFDVDYPPPPILPVHLGIVMLRFPRERARYKKLSPPERRAYTYRQFRMWKGRLLTWLTPRRMRRKEDGGNWQVSADPTKHIEQALGRARDAMWSYTPSPYPGRVALFLSAETGVWFHRDRRLDWRRMALGGCEVRVIPGEHDHALEEPHVPVAAARLRACIDAAWPPRRQAGAPPPVAGSG